MKRIVVFLVLAAAIAGCSSPKKVTEPPRESAYTTSHSYTAPASAVAQPVASPAVEQKVHTVLQGESLSVIAKQYGVTVKAIAEANNITNPDKIRVNQKLVIPEDN